MTREEAIKVLQKNRPSADPRRCGLELCTAVDVAIAALREQTRWIPVTERLPEPDTDVLTRRSIGTMDVEVYHEDEVAWTWDGYSKGFVTHWMPLPDGPEVKE